MKPILVIGQHGQLAQALSATQPEHYSVDYHGRQTLDICNQAQLKQRITEKQYKLVINASGYTQVDRAEADSQTAFKLNHLAVENLAEHCAQHAIRLIHLSSDYVFNGIFDGQPPTPYRPSNTPHPISRYGESKWRGEQAVLKYNEGHACIVRTSWLYSPFGHNFVKTMLTLMRQGKALSVIDDQWGTPTSAIALSQFIWQLTEISSPSPIYHWSDLGETTWYEFARRISDTANALGLLHQTAAISPISTQSYGAEAPRPRYSALDCSQSQAILQAQSWQENLYQVLKQLAKEG